VGELFDRYVVVDWSAAGVPKSGRDSVWIAVTDDQGHEPELVNPATRDAAASVLRAVADPAVRTLVAVDASLGCPRGSAARFGIDTAPPWLGWWREVGRLIVDREDNHNNRFEVAAALNRRVDGPGPFWGRPRRHVLDGLAPTKPARFPVPEFRIVESWLRDRGLRPASCWQLLGAGSVGGQTLTLLPILHRWFDGGGVEVWPFTTGLAAPQVPAGTVVLAETWPTGFDVDLAAHAVRDAAQVRAVALELRRADRSGVLAEWFAPRDAGVVRDDVESEEGWVLVPS
jgi:precorrin-8X/cobalt-precorrin-8 methylmutase